MRGRSGVVESWAAIALAAVITVSLGCAAHVPTIAYEHGRWLIGDSFVERRVYSVADRLTFARPRRVDKTIDLHNGYVVPPFAEAHNHNVEYTNPSRTAGILARYLA